jgi:AICAR transformylase/IMP cyclohydrolase PurH
MPDLVPIRRALISVSDKTDLIPFARALSSRGVEIISTGGTAKALAEAGIPVTPIDKVTGFPEMMTGASRPCNPMVHGGLLALRDNPRAHGRDGQARPSSPSTWFASASTPSSRPSARPGIHQEEAHRADRHRRGPA